MKVRWMIIESWLPRWEGSELLRFSFLPQDAKKPIIILRFIISFH